MAKPTITQNTATLQVSGTHYGFRWYRDGKLVEGDQAALTLTEHGKYKALVKVESDNDSWLISNEIEVNDLNGGATAISPNQRKTVQPKARKLRHKVDVKGRRAE